ncbi:PP2C family protein-serine/threonine phosphatase [Caballeronia mineralivorans]|uniref:PP2C family protein-serine/threonine phosphatase n=1 Tax=Caballeronia mineralivorans TaxID=2010198 RepID=UPI00389926EB
MHAAADIGGLVSNTGEFRWASAARTDTGLVREINEDACLEMPEHGLWAIADGMGGHAVGDVASQMVIERLAHSPAPGKPVLLDERMQEARERLLAVNADLRSEAARRQVRRIGSTVVLLLASERSCGYLWAGDSRLYLCRQGCLRQLTRDHSQVEELKARGQLSAEEALHHPGRHLITRAVGAMDTLDLDADRIDLHDGDIFLLCSDGLSNEVSDEEIGGVLTSGDCQQAVAKLVELALRRGGRDNVSVVVAQAEDIFCLDKTQINPTL